MTRNRLANVADADAITRIYRAAADRRTVRSEDYNEGIGDRVATSFETVARTTEE